MRSSSHPPTSSYRRSSVSFTGAGEGEGETACGRAVENAWGMMRANVGARRGIEGLIVGAEKRGTWRCTVTCRGNGPPALVDGGKGGLPRERHLAAAASLVSQSERIVECEPSFFVKPRGWCRLAENLERQSSDRPNAFTSRRRAF